MSNAHVSERWLGPLSPQRASDTGPGGRWLSLSFWPPWPACSAVAAARPGREPSITPKEEVVWWGLAYHLGVGLTRGDWNKCAGPWKEEVEANEQRQIQASHESARKLKRFLSSANDGTNSFILGTKSVGLLSHKQWLKCSFYGSEQTTDKCFFFTIWSLSTIEENMQEWVRGGFFLLCWLTMQGICSQRVENIGWTFNQCCLRRSQCSNSLLEVNRWFSLVQDINSLISKMRHKKVVIPISIM